jgi:ubiquinone/menaquinone biosynthesis C-methylase UbiE
MSYKITRDFALSYDNYIRKGNWYAPEILFGLCYDRLPPRGRCLDLGIGTGLGAALFHKAGLDVIGIDHSEEMLRICRKKKVAKELIKLNFLRCLLPFDNNHFELVLSCGVFHLLGELKPVFTEISRVLKPGSLLAFTIDEWDYKKDARFSKIPGKNIWKKTNPESGITHYKHSRAYLDDIMYSCRFQICKKTTFLAFVHPDHSEQTHFTAYTAIKE